MSVVDVAKIDRHQSLIDTTRYAGRLGTGEQVNEAEKVLATAGTPKVDRSHSLPKAIDGGEQRRRARHGPA